MSDKEQPKNVYRVLFHSQGQVYEVYAHNIYQSDLYGFVEIEDYTLNPRSRLKKFHDLKFDAIPFM